ncbi:MAG TPA: CHAT domain-containing protein, partial [Thermoanaerobaculia bacterium]|nr:CHAT domain-containing protein [Thermoanaerobaculia bacterium]
GDRRYPLLRTERRRFQNWRVLVLSRDDGATYRAGYPPPTVDEVRAGMDPGTVLLSYFVAADHIDLLVLVAGGALTLHRLEVDEEELARHLAAVVPSAVEEPRGAVALRRRAVAAARDRAQESARWLFAHLIGPAERELATADRLLIVPDGPLARLPFGALIRRGSSASETYLVEWKPLHVVHSAATYLALLEGRRDNPRRVKSLLALGDPDYELPSAGGDRQGLRPAPVAVRLARERGMLDGLARLPGTAPEVTEIGKLFTANGAAARVLLGARANEAALKEGAIATYVHLAVHGFVDGEQPDHSFLALSLPETLREDDENGILEAWEVVDNVRLDAELVTLSACETALGPERDGEGAMSLARAFQVAGARSVLASLWQVDDAATSQLMISFYRHLLAGSSKDVALRAAQLELLRSPDLASPYYWAAFQLNGDWR